MITALSGSADKASGAAVRSPTEDALKRADAPRAPKPSVNLALEPESSVVEISREGARRAAQQSQPGSAPSATETPRATEDSLEEAPYTPTEEARPTATSSEGEPRASLAQPQDLSTVKEFDDADTNQDYTVSVLERRAYDFLHPSLTSSSEAEPSALAPEGTYSRAVDAELKAYTEIARAGRMA